MPLKRINAYPPLTGTYGVHFTMADLDRVVRCAITRGALEKLTGRKLHVDEFEEAFYNHRRRIEAAATRNYKLPATRFLAPLTLAPADFHATAVSGSRLFSASDGTQASTSPLVDQAGKEFEDVPRSLHQDQRSPPQSSPPSTPNRARTVAPHSSRRFATR